MPSGGHAMPPRRRFPEQHATGCALPGRASLRRSSSQARWCRPVSGSRSRAVALAQRARALHPVGDRGNQILGRIGLDRKSSPPTPVPRSACPDRSPDRNTIGVFRNSSRSRIRAVEFGAVALRHVEVHQHQIEAKRSSAAITSKAS